MADRIQNGKKTNIGKRIAIIIGALVVLWFALFGIYLSDEHTGDSDALNAINSPKEGVSTIVTDDTITFVPEGEIKAGIVFYPGMKIRGEAYSLLAESLSCEGYLCVLVNMPLNMAVLNPNAALSVIEMWPEVEDFYIGGHSMGGQAAERCVLEHPGVFKGLITVARQLDYDFSENVTPVLGIYGSRDEICTLEDVAGNEKRANAEYYTEVIIEGGCHGYFGNYGEQKWDGEPTITREEQIEATARAILKFCEN